MNTDQFDLFVEDLIGEKLERPLIIVGASKIDDLLFSILTRLLLPPIKSDDDLLKGDSPLSTFSSRIKLVYRLGIIDEDFFKILEQIRKLRNLCAHSVEFDMRKSPVRDHILELRKKVTIRQSFELTKKRFFQVQFRNNEELQCIFVTVCVILESIHEAIVKTMGDSKTLKISSK